MSAFVAARSRAAGLPRWPLVAAVTAGRRTLANRSGLAATAFFYLVASGVVGSLWRAAAETTATGTLVGYDARAFTWYIAISEVAMMALPFRMVENVGDDIAGGEVASDMLRPASVVGVRIAAAVGAAIPRMGACLAVGVAASLLIVGRPPDLAAFAFLPLALLLAVVTNVACQHAVASAAFWVRDAQSAWFVYQKFVLILGGVLMPLQVMPDWLEAVAVRLPFAAMAYVPARLASGHVEPELLALQAGWMVVATGLAVVTFARGERRLQAVGG